ncbi:GIY-YIG nuclease family protein [Metabacillus halosaccharovorans]|uniref:GIY-YIG nuclease family protein n=1 Tax=Metabacillus halosaccharovorans TaxID=930124 RepID=A0ABT3DCB4_9BACI|nr:GIY-YIG nuclease family protein [Metabacillus halosaccharovorans]MCV9884619.1 GIY-YIG nuclease family protein [Metabacillus halosaccharovorans]
MVQNEVHYFYVLECSDGSYYAGYTVNLERRIHNHNTGKGAKYTRGRTPVKLLYSEKFESKSEALKMEIKFKKFSKKRKQSYIEGR